MGITTKRKIKYLFVFLPVLVILLQRPFPSTIFKLNQLEIFSLNQNRGLYRSSKVGKIMENKVWLYGAKFKSNFAQGIDLNYYFFANHPRERAGVTEKEIFPWFSLPLFLVGICLQIKRKAFLGIIYFFFTLTIISFFQNFDHFTYLLWPFFLYSFLMPLCPKSLK